MAFVAFGTVPIYFIRHIFSASLRDPPAYHGPTGRAADGNFRLLNPFARSSNREMSLKRNAWVVYRAFRVWTSVGSRLNRASRSSRMVSLRYPSASRRTYSSARCCTSSSEIPSSLRTRVDTSQAILSPLLKRSHRSQSSSMARRQSSGLASRCERCSQ